MLLTLLSGGSVVPRLYYVVGLASGWSDPTDVEVVAGQLSGGGPATAAASEVAPTTTTTFDFAAVTGLTSGVSYRVAFVWYDGTGDFINGTSNVVVSGIFTTLANVGFAGLSTESDLALALSSTSGATTGIATEVDTALACSPIVSKAAGLATEVDTAQALSVRALKSVGLATEVDTALACSPIVSKVAGLATEVDTAQALSVGASNSVGLATEVDSALALVGRQVKSTSLSIENDQAFALTKRQLSVTGLAFESSISLSCKVLQLRDVGLCVESNLSQQLYPTGYASEYPLYSQYTVIGYDSIYTVPSSGPRYIVSAKSGNFTVGASQ